MKFWKHSFILLSMATLLIASCSKKDPEPGVKKGDIALSIVGSDTAKNIIDIEDYKGKVLVVDFWATWCPPCRKKIPSMIKTQEQYADKGVQVLGISLDRSVDALMDYEKSENLNFPSIYYGANDIANDYNIRSIPTVLIINKDGIITYRGYGSNLDQKIEQALEG